MIDWSVGVETKEDPCFDRSFLWGMGRYIALPS